MKNQFEKEMEWPETVPSFSDLSQAKWSARKPIMEMLCHLAKKVVWWGNGDGSSLYRRMPSILLIKTIPVMFHPHTETGSYNVGGVELELPQSEEDVLSAVKAALVLESLGMKIDRERHFT